MPFQSTILRFGLLSSFLMILTGCGPTETLTLPEQWPVEWEGRQLYHTPNCFIYASSDQLAGEADQMTRAVGEAFLEDTGVAPPKGLIIVNDEKDPVLIYDRRLWFNLLTKGKVLVSGEEPPTAEELNEKWMSMEQTNAELGIHPLTQLKMLPVQFDRQSFGGCLSFPDGMPDEIDWAVMIPSRSVLNSCNSDIIDAQLEKEDIGIIARAAMSPMLAVAVKTAEETCVVAQKVAVYARCAIIAGKSNHWPPDRIRSQIQSFSDREYKKVLGELKTAAQTELQKAENNQTTDPDVQEPAEKQE